jgi:hypothetical protein
MTGLVIASYRPEPPRSRQAAPIVRYGLDLNVLGNRVGCDVVTAAFVLLALLEAGHYQARLSALEERQIDLALARALERMEALSVPL